MDTFATRIVLYARRTLQTARNELTSLPVAVQMMQYMVTPCSCADNAYMTPPTLGLSINTNHTYLQTLAYKTGNSNTDLVISYETDYCSVGVGGGGGGRLMRRVDL